MATNFFQQQDLARRNTRLLVVIFGMAVLSLIVLTNLLVMISLGFVQDVQSSFMLPWEVISSISLVVIAVVGLAIMAKWQRLKQGGRTIAEALGGIRVTPDTADSAERRLLNVVEEMALAANLPVPPVYLLPESGINAFAAGYSQSDAVIGITQGSLQQLSRDELQGVIAHEFSHILNGDMRMNIRLIAILNGILFIGHIGYYLLRSGRGSSALMSSRTRNKNAGGLLLFGIGLVVIGYLGSFFGNLIKAAVSRQREYLADASAVQFSRNPLGISGALKRIGGYQAGSKINHPNADEMSHLFFGEALSRWTSIFATHPPLAKRIQRLDPTWNGRFAATTSPKKTSAEQTTSDSPALSARQSMLAALPLLLSQSSHQLLPAKAIVCAMLLTPEQLATQLAMIKNQGSPTLLQQVDQLADEVSRLPLAQQVQLLQLTIPTLKQLSASEFQQFSALLQQLTANNPSLQAWLCLNFIQHTVASQFSAKDVHHRAHSHSLAQLQPQLTLLFSALADCAGPEQAEPAWQAAWQQLTLPKVPAKPVTDYQALTAALPMLIDAAPKVKQQLWQAVLVTIAADKHFSDAEQAMTNLLAMLLEMPVPLTADFS
ncbi:MAG: M48 family metallopeptidase [Alishewanella sp.]|nr:M48 family metallopeptidase [Alishewanella sp.]MDP5036905.1 M48 family metallopeptidase [Alishewanella sp.]MDP5185855.1 M48 family metallopeptidase [Alishewanella sp.]